MRWWVPIAAMPLLAAAGDVLQTEGFSTCLNEADIQVDNLNLEYNRITKQIEFDISGVSNAVQKVSVILSVSAYGKQVYRNQFDPCDNTTQSVGLCPIPAGRFSASGTQVVPDKYASQIPSIAYSVPDLEGAAVLKLVSIGDGKEVACITSTVKNGKTMSVKGVSYVSAAIAGAALIVSGISSLGAAGASGASGGSLSPTFTETMTWFQSVAVSGMLSVNYPPVYLSFTTNFGFSTGLVTWDGLQRTIDDFRGKTGGNLTANSIELLRNTTLVRSTTTTEVATNETTSKIRRGLLFLRDITTDVGNTTETEVTTTSNSTISKQVSGIEAYVEQLAIPQTNTFMTVLLFFCCAVAAITVSILLFKVILEAWAMFGKIPEKLNSFRKRYWWVLAKTITNLILILYGMWTLYCIYQFTNGDSWAAKLLAGITLGLFTATLIYFTVRIWLLARRSKQVTGDASNLYEEKEVWVKYNIFYENYKKSYWWIFVPVIIYMFVKGCIVAGGNGHGLAQVSAQIILEGAMLILLLVIRPYGLRSSNWINISIQVVRFLSAICILLFVEKLGIAQTAKSVTGVALVAIQSILTGVLAVLIIINAIVLFFRANPHRKRRKQAEKEASPSDLGLEKSADTYTDVESSTIAYTGADPTRQSLALTGKDAEGYNGRDDDFDGVQRYSHVRPDGGNQIGQPRLSNEYLLGPDPVATQGAAVAGPAQTYKAYSPLNQ